MSAFAVAALSVGLAAPAAAAPTGATTPAGWSASDGPVTKVVVWGDSMTQIWPGYLEDLIGIPVVPSGAGGSTVQQTQTSFTTWVDLHRDDADFATTGHLCWCGHTNLNQKNAQSPLTNRFTVLPALQAMAAQVPAGLFRPLGLTNGPEAPLGSTGYRQSVDDGDPLTRTAVNETIADAFGESYAEVRAFLVSDGLRVAGMTATAEDLANVASDVPPRSLRTDVGNPAHLNDAGRHVTAAHLADLLRTGGWVPAATNDADGDGIVDAEDNCPVTANSDQLDTDQDGVGEVCRGPVGVVVANSSVTENYATATFTVTLTNPVAVESSVGYSTADGSAVAGEDYTAVAAGSRLTFPAGRTTGYISVPVTPDSTYEPDEYFSVLLSDPSATVTILDATALGTIFNDDPLPPALDTIPPTVTKQIPAVDARVVAPTSNTSLTFSEPVLGVSLTTVTLVSATGTSVTADVALTNAGKTATLNPRANLIADTRYTATFLGGPGAITDRAGNAFETLSWSFVTGPAPKLKGVTPSNGTVGVSVDGNVTVTITENLSGVTDTTFRLLDPSGTLVPAVVSRFPNSTLKWTLDPKAPLTPGATYTVTLIGGSTAITDLAGNPLPTFSSTFTTRA